MRPAQLVTLPRTVLQWKQEGGGLCGNRDLVLSASLGRKRMDSDSVIAQEVRQRRNDISERFGDDLARYAQHLQAIQVEFVDRVVDQVSVVKSRPAQPE